MNTAVINTGGKQYLVQEGQELWVDMLGDAAKKTISFKPLLVFNDKETLVGAPEVKEYAVKAEVVEGLVKGPKIKVVKFKAKKRVHKTQGHRQKYSLIKITSIGK